MGVAIPRDSAWLHGQMPLPLWPHKMTAMLPWHGRLCRVLDQAMLLAAGWGALLMVGAIMGRLISRRSARRSLLNSHSRLCGVPSQAQLLGFVGALLVVEVVVMMVFLNRGVAGRPLGLGLVVGAHCPALVALGLGGHLHGTMGRVYHAHNALRIMVDDLDNLHGTAGFSTSAK